jgi:hypothetical protein
MIISILLIFAFWIRVAQLQCIASCTLGISGKQTLILTNQTIQIQLCEQVKQPMVIEAWNIDYLGIIKNTKDTSAKLLWHD